jgi:hypothetical protein
MAGMPDAEDSGVERQCRLCERQRSNPGPQGKSWIASSQGLLAMTLRRCSTHRRHTPRRRGIQYAASSRIHHRPLGILDRPPEPVIGRRFAPTRWRTMTNLGILATHCARVLQIRFALKKKRAQRDPQERARGRPGARCTRGLVCKGSNKKRTRAYRFSGSIRPSLRNGFTAYLRALPGETRACLSPSPA